ncbi:MAG: MFS transporter, partial [Actinomycetota bacterium]
ETLLGPTLNPIVNDLAPDELRGRYNGVSTLAWTTGFMLGPTIAGFALAAERPAELFLGLVVACGVAAVLARRLEAVLPAQVNRIGEGEPEVTDTAPAKGDLVPPGPGP